MHFNNGDLAIKAIAKTSIMDTQIIIIATGAATLAAFIQKSERVTNMHMIVQIIRPPYRAGMG
jgi:hypothetical protein